MLKYREKIKTLMTLIFFLSAWGGLVSSGAAVEWPREIEAGQTRIIIYQPQPESLSENVLRGRAAILLEDDAAAEEMFGAIWFTARLEVDYEERLAVLRDLSLEELRLPGLDEEKFKHFNALLLEEVPGWELPLSLDQLLATLESQAVHGRMAEKIKHDPPRIIFMAEPAILVSIDGEPRLVSEDDGALLRVINTPFTILLLPEEKQYYLYADRDTWYRAAALEGEWRLATSVPARVAARAPALEPDDLYDPNDDFQPGPPPKIVVATEATELISSLGRPEFSPVQGTSLLYLSNSDSDVLLSLENRLYYVLLAGRWFAGAQLENGVWRHVPGDELPAAFAAIPEDSEVATVLYAVPGTEAAREAALAAQIPETARIDREKAELVVEYDGEPCFETIAGTRMMYAVNTATPVIYAERSYFACDDAVWFVAAKATGPWRVAASIPAEIYSIPPDNPLYNVTFVRIYGVTPEEVCFGYTFGYNHTYLCYDTVVYGTGYAYSGWYSNWYYPRPQTWGYHVRYGSWSGWSFGFSYGRGPYPFSFGRGWYRGSWWGPAHYRGYHDGYRHGYRRGYDMAYHYGRLNRGWINFYHSRKNMPRWRTQTDAAPRTFRIPSPRRGERNDVFVDRLGRVHRKRDNGWETRTGSGWQPLVEPRKKPEVERRPPVKDRLGKDRGRSEPEGSGISRERGGAVRTSAPSSRVISRQNPPPTREDKSGAGAPPSSARKSSETLERSYQTRERGNLRQRNFERSRNPVVPVRKGYR
ncbi:MAG TPA: hypothetical protein ENN66_09415 [Proteobacteria bacterium]|nr:hypothetical protein [Pseudomonadota bacterium]